MPAFPSASITGPSTFTLATAITVGQDIVPEPVALFVANAGTLTCQNTDGTTVTIGGTLPAGTVVPFRVKRVVSGSGTFLALY